MASRSIAKTDVAGSVRLALRLAILILTLTIAVPLHLGFRALHLRSPWPRWFLASVARISGAIVRKHGMPLKSNVFYVSNHVSWMDIPVLAGPTGAAFVAQAEIAGWPLIGWLSKLNNTVFIARGDRSSIAHQVQTLRTALEARQPVVVFPEGTTTDGQSLLPFKPSLFAAVTPPPRPMLIQPVMIDYGKLVPEFAWIDEEPAGGNAMRLLSRRGTFAVNVHFLEPFDPADLPDRKSVTLEARKRIAGALSASLSGVAIV